MKKNKILIITFTIIFLISIGGLSYYCYYLYSQNEVISSENDSLNKNLSDLESSIDEKKSYIDGQKEYIDELNDQMAEAFSAAQSQDDSLDDYISSDDTDSTYDSNYDPYPNLYAHDSNSDDKTQETKTAYLTFDDGPCSTTPQVLDLLDQYDAKATFFVVYTEDGAYSDYLNDIADKGHTLALHSYSHDYDKIYASVDAFLDDFSKVFDWVYETTGVRCTLYRFPGGSVSSYSKNVIDDIIAEMERRGFTYYDWNVSSGDGSNLTTSYNIIDNICNNIGGFKEPVVLMHDAAGKSATLNALPTVLSNLNNLGYTFSALNDNMEPIQYPHN